MTDESQFDQSTNRWGIVIAHSPKAEVLNEQPYKEIREYTPYVSKVDFSAAEKALLPNQATACFTMLVKNNNSYHLKVNLAGWGEVKDDIQYVELHYSADEVNSDGSTGALISSGDMSVTGSIVIEKYRVELLQDKPDPRRDRHRDFITWKNKETGETFETSYIWCSALHTRPRALDGSEMQDEDFDKS